MSVENLVVVDIETSGLNEKENTVLEIALVLVTPDYVEKSSWYTAVLKLPKRGTPYSGSPDLTVAVMHALNGLWEACVGEEAKSKEEVDAELVNWCKFYGIQEQSIYLQGRTVSFDHSFLKEHFPRFATYLHYRVDDTGSVQRYLERLGVKVATPATQSRHRALPDAQYALTQLREYRQAVREALDAGKK